MQPSQYPNETSGELPSPQQYDSGQKSPEVPAQPVGEEKQQAISIEQGMSFSQSPQQQMGAQPMPPMAAAGTPSDDPHAPVGASQHSPQIADDSDLIEKEWVTKAKHIVEQTKHDPYVQNQEVNKMKADYLKKRYNKDLKLSEN